MIIPTLPITSTLVTSEACFERSLDYALIAQVQDAERAAAAAEAGPLQASSAAAVLEAVRFS